MRNLKTHGVQIILIGILVFLFSGCKTPLKNLNPLEFNNGLVINNPKETFFTPVATPTPPLRKVSNSTQQIVFSSERDGNAEIYIMNSTVISYLTI